MSSGGRTSMDPWMSGGAIDWQGGYEGGYAYYGAKLLQRERSRSSNRHISSSSRVEGSIYVVYSRYRIYGKYRRNIVEYRLLTIVGTVYRRGYSK